MTSNSTAEFETKQEPDWHQDSNLSKYNTYIVRSFLKGLSGLLFAISFLPIIYSWTPSTIEGFPLGLGTFLIAIGIWIVFYRMELQYRSRAPDRAL